MKALAIVAALLLAQTAPNPAGQESGRATIEGLVTRIGTSEPIAGARVTLVRNDRAILFGEDAAALTAEMELRGPDTSFVALLSTTTDSRGRFSIVVPAPVSYRLVVSANSYVRQEYRQRTFPGVGTPIGLFVGQTISGIDVPMTRSGSVEGIVRDDTGNPLANVMVKLQKYVYGRDGVASLKQFTAARTNDRGEYRLYFVTPGRYYLQADSGPSETNIGNKNRNESPEQFEPVFYPNATEIRQATLLDVQAGTDRPGLDFALKRRKQTYKIRGSFIDLRTGRAPEQSSLVLYFISSDPAGGVSASRTAAMDSTLAAPTGAFEFRDVNPGFYSIYSVAHGTALTVGVVNTDVENVALSVPGHSIPGSFRIEGTPLANRPGPTTPRVVLQTVLPDGSTREIFGARPEDSLSDPNGKFEVAKVRTTQDYLVTIMGFPPEYYVKQARLGGIDVLNRPFRPSDSGTLELVIGSDSGQLTGTVLDDKLKPVEEIRAVLIPDRWRGRPETFRFATTDRNGHFSIQNIPPGDYKIFAWEAIDPYSWFDPEVLRRFESKGQAIHVSESSKQSVQVKLIPFSQ